MMADPVGGGLIDVAVCGHIHDTVQNSGRFVEEVWWMEDVRVGGTGRAGGGGRSREGSRREVRDAERRGSKGSSGLLHGGQSVPQRSGARR